MGSLFKKKKDNSGSDNIMPVFPDPRSAPPEYFNLFQAAGGDDLEGLKRMLKKLPPMAVQVQLGPQSLLHCAAQNGGRRVVHFLLEQGLDKNVATTTSGVTPLMYAVQGSHSDIVETLLIAGADPKRAISNSDPRYPGLTPLHFAVGAGDKQLVGMLLKHGADPRQGDRDGQTACDLAQRMRHDELIALLEQGAPTSQDLNAVTDPQKLAQIASDCGTVDDGLAIIPKIEALRSQHAPDVIEGCIAMVAINLSSRATSGPEAQRCFEHFKKLQLSQHEGAQANLSNALRSAASNARPAQAGYEIAQLIRSLPLFASELDFREAYANTLFNISVVADEGAYCNKLAQEIAELPGFAESPTMHFNCGRVLSNASGKASSGPEARSYAAVIPKLPLFQGMPQLHEAYERAQRNCRRFD
jgi:ankyrin repeat protein